MRTPHCNHPPLVIVFPNEMPDDQATLSALIERGDIKNAAALMVDNNGRATFPDCKWCRPPSFWQRVGQRLLPGPEGAT